VGLYTEISFKSNFSNSMDKVLAGIFPVNLSFISSCVLTFIVSVPDLHKAV